MTSLILSAVSGALLGVLVTYAILKRQMNKSANWGRAWQQRALAAEQRERDQDETLWRLVEGRDKGKSIFDLSPGEMAQQWRAGLWRGF